MKLLTLKDAVDFAIQREEEAMDNYGKMIQLGKTPGLKKLLQELQEEEKNHKKLLQGLDEDKIQSYEPSQVIDLKVSDYLEEGVIEEDMDFQDALIIAAKKEKSSIELYLELSKKAETEELKKLFDYLVEQEKNHKLKLENEYEKHVLEEN